MRALILAFSITLAMPAYAGETAWQEVAPGVSMRLISSGQIAPDGTTQIAIEIDMPETSKTYWRVPGDTGLPTELDFAGSSGLHRHRIVWPYPTRYQTAEYLDYAYFGPTVLPVELTVAPGAPHVELSAILGICSEICVPAQARFSLPLNDTEPDRANGLRIRQALAEAPLAWTEGPQPFGAVEFRDAENALAVELTDPTLDADLLIAATADGEPLFGTPQKSPETDLVLIPILGKADEIDLENQAVQLTFMTDMGAFEVERTVEGAPAK